MLPLRTCSTCDGLIPAHRARCVHCDAPATSAQLGLLALGSTGQVVAFFLALAAQPGRSPFVTMGACYGGPPQALTDPDGDGAATARFAYATPADCDDADPAVHPGAPDIDGDGRDSDCDGRDAQAPRP